MAFSFSITYVRMCVCMYDMIDSLYQKCFVVVSVVVFSNSFLILCQVESIWCVHDVTSDGNSSGRRLHMGRIHGSILQLAFHSAEQHGWGRHPDLVILFWVLLLVQQQRHYHFYCGCMWGRLPVLCRGHVLGAQ